MGVWGPGVPMWRSTPHMAGKGFKTEIKTCKSITNSEIAK